VVTGAGEKKTVWLPDGTKVMLNAKTILKIESTKKDLQPGEPTTSTWTVANNDADQPLQFVLEVKGDTGAISNRCLT
jgi:hypothetical protein